ncbi:MAG TPA: PIG-L family deacetylase [Acidimicrobiia bacterium]|nr:PIG-L family deacetylase [Acidimicrobiia bacterium]
MAQTLVAFHAHPDDESITTGGVLAQAADAGHRVVLVVATRGELGTAGPSVLPAGSELGAQRVRETYDAARILGVSRVEFLGYHDSGMAGATTNDAPGSFWSADPEEAATRLAAILEDERADALLTYDERGIYDHPDHVQVHRVGLRAADLHGTPCVYETTIDASYLRNLMDHATELLPDGLPTDGPDVPSLDLGVDPTRITTTIDVADVVDRKRAALAAHATQVDETSFFLAMPVEAFRMAFRYEWFMRRDAPPGTRETTLLGS